MTIIEQEEYLEAIGWFGEMYDGSNGDIIIGQMYEFWPMITLLLVKQGFFISILQNN